MGFKLPAKLEFDVMTFGDEVAEKALLIQLHDRNLMSDELIQQKNSIDPELEKVRQNQVRNPGNCRYARPSHRSLHQIVSAEQRSAFGKNTRPPFRIPLRRRSHSHGASRPIRMGPRRESGRSLNADAEPPTTKCWTLWCGCSGFVRSSALASPPAMEYDECDDCDDCDGM